MELSFPWPYSQGEWLAWSSAAITVLFGLMTLFAPRFSLRILRLQTTPDHPEAVAESRATMSGFYLGVGLCCILLAQPLLYLTLGACWALTAFGRVVSMLSDRGNTPYNWVALIVEIVLGALPMAFALGFAV
ncbi:AGROH133_08824 family phage infection protein [Aliihoeflea sp. PC F10.4]